MDRNYLKKTKIRIKDRAQMIVVQKTLFALNIGWSSDNRKSLEYLNSKGLFISNDLRITFCTVDETFNNHEYDVIYQYTINEVLKNFRGNKQMNKEDFKETKIAVDSERESTAIQELLFELGIFWSGSYNPDKVHNINAKYLFIDHEYKITYCTNTMEYFDEHENKELYIEDILAMKTNEDKKMNEFEKVDISNFDTDNLIAGMAKIVEEKKGYEIEQAAKEYKRITDEMDSLHRKTLILQKEIAEIEEEKIGLGVELAVFKK